MMRPPAEVPKSAQSLTSLRSDKAEKDLWARPKSSKSLPNLKGGKSPTKKSEMFSRATKKTKKSKKDKTSASGAVFHHKGKSVKGEAAAALPLPLSHSNSAVELRASRIYENQAFTAPPLSSRPLSIDYQTYMNMEAGTLQRQMQLQQQFEGIPRPTIDGGRRSRSRRQRHNSESSRDDGYMNPEHMDSSSSSSDADYENPEDI
jgi:hypothetical protein